MRAGINCALANRQILTHLTREVFADVLPQAELHLLYDVSHNTCKEEEHTVEGDRRRLFVHRKGATRAFGPGHPELTESLRHVGQPVLIGGTMGTESHVLVGTRDGMARSYGSACHGAGRRVSRHQAAQTWRGRSLVDELAERGIMIRSVGLRGVAEEARALTRMSVPWSRPRTARDWRTRWRGSSRSSASRDEAVAAVAVATERWEHFAHGADVGIRGVGPTPAAAFAQAALAMTAVITDTGLVEPRDEVTIECEAASLDRGRPRDGPRENADTPRPR